MFEFLKKCFKRKPKKNININEEFDIYVKDLLKNYKFTIRPKII